MNLLESLLYNYMKKLIAKNKTELISDIPKIKDYFIKEVSSASGLDLYNLIESHYQMEIVSIHTPPPNTYGELFVIMRDETY